MWSQAIQLSTTNLHETPPTQKMRTSAPFRSSRAFERSHPLLGHAPVADRLRSTAMDSAERYRRAYAEWRTVDAEIDAPRHETEAKARRLAAVAADLQRARSAKARLTSLVSMLRYLAAVITRSWAGQEGWAR